MSTQAASASTTSQIVNPIIASCVDVFGTMVGVQLHRRDLELLTGKTPFFPITAIIQLSGKARGSICLSMQRRTAFSLVHRMLDIQVNEVDAIVCDTVAEFTNVIAGHAKDELQSLEMELGLPNIIRGNDCQIGFPDSVTPMKVTFSSELGPLMIAFGFAEVAQ